MIVLEQSNFFVKPLKISTCIESSLFVRRFKTDPEGYNIQVVKQDRQEY